MSSNSPHILSNFDDELAALRADVLKMASLAGQNLEQALRGLFEGDDALCNSSIANDEEVDQLEKSIDARGIEILMRFQPLARDLRHVVSAMKVSTNLERVADKAVGIARKAKKLNAGEPVPELEWIRPLSERAVRLYQRSIRAFERADRELADTIKSEDIQLDAEHEQLGERLLEHMSRGGEQTAALLNLMFVCRHLERVGDHATNVAEDVVFAAAAEDIRHLPRS